MPDERLPDGRGDGDAPFGQIRFTQMGSTIRVDLAIVGDLDAAAQGDHPIDRGYNVACHRE